MVNRLWRIPLNALQVLAALLWSFFWISISLLGVLLTGKRGFPLRVAHIVWAPYLLKLAGVRLQVSGHPQVDFSKPHVYVMNHQSALDILVACTVLPVNLHFLAKAELRHVPLLGWVIAASGMIFIDRRSRSRSLDSFQKAVATIGTGKSLIAFPEGTRSPDGEIKSFKSGAFMAAILAGVEIVPVVVEGTAAILPPGTLQLRPGLVRAVIGAPIPTSGLSGDRRRELTEGCRLTMLKLQQGLRQAAEKPG